MLKYTFIIFLLIGLIACKQERVTVTADKQPDVGIANNNIDNHFTQQQQDSLLADAITFIYRKPRLATNQTRFNPEFRHYYVNQLPRFKWINYAIDDEGTHYFYLLRPARSLHGNMRGVGGLFNLNDNGEIVNFEEIWNTPVFPEDELIEKGNIMFTELLSRGNLDNYMGNPAFVEWPDNRLKYDKTLNEWRYDVEEEN